MGGRRLIGALLAWTAMTVMSASLCAQPYPSRPIRLIVPSSPGGANDIIGRLWAERLGSFATFVVENRGGAGTLLGTTEVARGTPDGYTLLLGSTNTHVLQPLSTSNRSYDPVADFAPISILGTTATAIAISGKLPMTSLREFVAHARANPGQVSFGHAGPGSNTFYTAEMFRQVAGGLDIKGVPYRGVGPSFADLSNGHIQMIVVNVTGQVMEYHTTGMIRVLAVNAIERIASAPQVPTSAEAGLPGLVSQTFYATFAPARTPPEVLAALDRTTQDALRDPEFRAKLASSGYDPLQGIGTEKAAQYVAAEYARWEPMIRRINTQN